MVLYSHGLWLVCLFLWWQLKIDRLLDLEKKHSESPVITGVQWEHRVCKLCHVPVPPSEEPPAENTLLQGHLTSPSGAARVSHFQKFW